MNPAASARLHKEREREELRKTIEHAVTDTLCACGCGGFTRRGRGVSANPYIHGHATKGRTFPTNTKAQTYKGGRHVKQSGYVVRLMRDHPRASYGYVGEHILIAEAALGKLLPVGSPVHHVDGNRSNNRNSNLVVCQDGAYHALLHRRARALRASGHPDYRPCGFCWQHDDVNNMAKWGTSGGFAHRECSSTYGVKRRAAKKAAA